MVNAVGSQGSWYHPMVSAMDQKMAELMEWPLSFSYVDACLFFRQGGCFA